MGRELIIISAVALNNREEEKILKKAESIFGKSQKSQFTVDPSIIGGLIIKTDDQILDLSIFHKLQEIKNHLGGPGES